MGRSSIPKPLLGRILNFSKLRSYPLILDRFAVEKFVFLIEKFVCAGNDGLYQIEQFQHGMTMKLHPGRCGQI